MGDPSETDDDDGFQYDHPTGYRSGASLGRSPARRFVEWDIREWLWNRLGWSDDEEADE